MGKFMAEETWKSEKHNVKWIEGTSFHRFLTGCKCLWLTRQVRLQHKCKCLYCAHELPQYKIRVVYITFHLLCSILTLAKQEILHWHLWRGKVRMPMHMLYVWNTSEKQYFRKSFLEIFQFQSEKCRIIF